jgi:hypothetical protein
LPGAGAIKPEAGQIEQFARKTAGQWQSGISRETGADDQQAFQIECHEVTSKYTALLFRPSCATRTGQRSRASVHIRLGVVRVAWSAAYAAEVN